MPINITEAGPKRINDIRSLWEKLNRHHAAVSAHFKKRFEKFTFDERADGLLDKAENGALRIFLAMNNDQAVGYCVVTLDRHGNGKIDSLFVDETCRGQGVADTLMRRSMEWLDAMDASAISISVVAGNEDVFGFYEQYGFLPGFTRLLRRQD